MEHMEKLLIQHVHREENLNNVIQNDCIAFLLAMKAVLHIIHEQSLLKWIYYI